MATSGQVVQASQLARARAQAEIDALKRYIAELETDNDRLRAVIRELEGYFVQGEKL